MRVDLFDFDLPKERIALRPASPRDSARCLVVRGETLDDRIMRDLPEYLQPGDVLLFNDTRVIPARLTGRKGEGKVEVTLHLRVDDACWRAFARPGKKLAPGVVITFDGGLEATVTDKGEGGEVGLRFNRAGADLRAALETAGVMPLPPYIAAQRAPDAQDQDDYQTMFASREGAVAAPTAGLHFTPELLAAIAARGVKQVAVTLHVGAGTFLPVKVDDTAEHKMHREWGEVSAEAAATIAEARAKGGRVIAIGTTALRILETAARADGTVRAWAGETDIFITPGYRFQAVDLLVTNFHLPRSTLFMLVSAFAGLDVMRAAYEHAISTGYRFYSYGDGSLLYRAP
ncbi:tRNA preQ1(34) S-adenosylmethionine ribosyltransferase-isomerase QueA [Govanella unica]|uniref:S-adenosylmethionine:tRNA ribosyltransferase-isomerase n=1 Tax=Govanella unica TaxID=2975056 RepID=A0A9X3TWW0_9PROT|nr:tRNA preQ1(34) S-adenosylmethionine ribosyltransferase-isomerase QueA [Govania unica]MDA5193241.1 tRNA preQ1(34) S-adenosylmethionine ribosyltransferase-isomerase QueA [Govania unica]